MKRRILISTRNGFKLYGDYYEVDENSPRLDPSTQHTQQDLMEFVKTSKKYRVNIETEYDYWKAISD